MLVELQQGLSEKDEKDDINQITDWTVENNPSITMVRDFTHFFGFVMINFILGKVCGNTGTKNGGILFIL